MRVPKLQFKFNEKKDFELAWSFYNSPKFGGRDFWAKGALQYHENLVSMARTSDPKVFLFNYVSSLYKLHGKKFERHKEEIMVLYHKNEANFFDAINKLFKNYPWPKGKYVAYLSVFDFCPRFLDDKTFFVFMYDSDRVILYTIFHEMLHFIFYDYCLKKHPKIFRNRDTERGPFWEIAELFNVIIQQIPEFVKLHGQVTEIGYPKLKSKLVIAKKVWRGDVDEWILKVQTLIS